MTLLALNMVLPQSMRAKYQLALAVLPVGLMFASFAPLWLFAPWLEAALGIPPNSPIRPHPNGGIWFGVFLVTMVVLMVLGYTIGWVANALISRYVLHWSPEKVRAVYMESDVPPHWLKGDAKSSSTAAAESIAKWEKLREVGIVRFIVVRGVLAWGAPMLLAMHIVPTLAKGRMFSIGDLLFNLGLWAVAGAVFGAAIWYGSEANYRKLKRRDEA
jgi:hypothetical protein